MELRYLLENICDYEINGSQEKDISGIFYDSRRVVKDSLFFCIKGTNTDGHEYALSAIEKGAVALVVERYLQVPESVTQILVKDSREAMAQIAANYYDNPTKKLKIIAVTGTNGKTTITYLIKSIGEVFGKKVGLIGTIHNMIGDRIIPTERTTPESMDLQRLFHDMVAEGVEWAVMEVSSHSLELGRVAGISFDVGIFTNLTQDHLDFHKTIENYRRAKKKLFYQSKEAVINLDDPSGSFMAEDMNIPVHYYGIKNKCEANACDINITAQGVTYELILPHERINVSLNIPGFFSVYNSMAAAVACMTMGVPSGDIKKGLEVVKSVAGRFEVLNTGREYTVILDYAHTPDGLENILKTVQGFAKGRIITLFGAGGDRDATKRPIMGEIAGRYSDFCIITSDNPRTEEPMSIIKQIEEGIRQTECKYICIENRKEAIRFALSNGKKNDVIVLAGKGHETYQEINGVKNHFDEKEIVDELLHSELV